MNGIKATIILCVTLLLIALHHYINIHHNYTVVQGGNEKGVYIFDQNNEQLYHCAAGSGCQHLLLPGQEEDAPAQPSKTPVPQHVDGAAVHPPHPHGGTTVIQGQEDQ